jgi:hypothetical protein
MDRLQRVQNAAARLLHGTSKFDSIQPILFDLHWFLIVFRIDYKIAVFTYRCLNGLSPRYLHSLLPVSSRLACDRLITAKSRTKLSVTLFKNFPYWEIPTDVSQYRPGEPFPPRQTFISPC